MPYCVISFLSDYSKILLTDVMTFMKIGDRNPWQ